jgi:mono/diheme cytochrome c family protein
MRESLVTGALAAGLALAALALTTGIGGGSAIEGGSSATAAAGEAPGHGVFVRMGCGSCHTLAAAGSAGTIGPNLDERLPGHTRTTLIAKITAPPPSGAMPTDFESRMEPDELDALVRFLLAARPTSPAR